MSHPEDDGRPSPVPARLTVLGNEPEGGYRRLTLTAPGPDARGRTARPGQFVAVAVRGGADGPSATLLRRAFSLNAAADGPDGPTYTLVVASHGPGSAWVASRSPGSGLEVLGPLGRPFPAPAPGAPVVLVGGGYGSAPLAWWARELRAAGHRVAAVLGAGDAARLACVEEVRGAVDELRLATDDGSAGERGRVTDVLDDLLAPGTEVYSCGPMAMLRAVTEAATARGARSWCTVEESMACGFGVCMTCVLPVRGADGVTRMTRSCTDGPTLDGTTLRWDALRTDRAGSDVPDDCLGAPVAAGGHR